MKRNKITVFEGFFNVDASDFFPEAAPLQKTGPFCFFEFLFCFIELKYMLGYCVRAAWVEVNFSLEKIVLVCAWFVEYFVTNIIF